MLTKMLMVMKLTAIFLLAVCLQVSATGFSQGVTLSFRNASLERVFKEVKKQTGYNFVYAQELLDQTDAVTIKTENLPLREALERCLQGMPLTFVIRDKFIIIKPGAIAPELPKVVETARPGVNNSKPKLQGRVMDEADPLGGATIKIRKEGHPPVSGTTDVNGAFRIMQLEKGIYTLEISFIGHEKAVREVTITEKQPATVLFILRKSMSTLDAIQTTAYSKTTPRFGTGDVTTITAEEIARNPVPNVLQSLQGRVPGMFVTETTGKINGAFQVQIRSLNTISGGATSDPTQIALGGQPLYIVDGVEYPASYNLPMLTNVPGFNQAFANGHALNYLDPSLIESINVLKGADATAIYGSRGAFGVILITTKKAKAGKPSLTINTAQGISTVGASPRMLDLKGYLALRRNAFANDSTTPGATDYDVNGAWDTTRGTDWKKFFLGSHASTTRANATYTGGSANSNYLLGVNYSAIGDIERSKGSVRQGGMSFSLNTATDDRKFTMTLSGSYTTQLDNEVPVDFASGGGITQAPDAPYPYLPNGKPDWAGGTNSAAALNVIYSDNTDNFLVNTNLTVTPLPGLSFSAVGGFNLLSAKEFEGEPSSFFNPATFTPSQAISRVYQYRFRTLSADPRVEYIHTWGKARLDLITGVSLRDEVERTTGIAGTGFASDQLLLDPAAGNTVFSSYNSTPDRYIGGFAVINFRWADKYILALNGRRDGSSVFGNDRQFGNFGSVAGAWILSEEPWFKRLRPVVDFLKIKVSYGLIGGSSIPPYSYISNYRVDNSTAYRQGLSLVPQTLFNPYLHWETNRNFEAGLNVDLFKGRVNVDATYYTDKAGDQLTNQPLGSITGYTSFYGNSQAKIRSYGGEFAIISHNIRNRSFSWTSGINLTIPRTKLLAYPGIDNLVGNYNYVVGKPITGLKLFRYAGVDPATGHYNFYNAAGQKGEWVSSTGNILLNPVTDRNAFVDFAPKWYGGVLNTLSYKNFSMDFLIMVTRRVGPDYQWYLTYTPGSPNLNIPAELAARRWMKKGDVTTVPKATASQTGPLAAQQIFRLSTGVFDDATYARLQNLSVSYRLPAQMISKAHLSALSVYVAGQNLLTVSPYKGLDPENMQAKRIPPLRVFTGGLNATF